MRPGRLHARRPMTGEPDIWSDPAGEWFQLRAPVSRTSVLFGPFAYTGEGRESHGAENAYHELIASGWTAEPRRDRHKAAFVAKAFKSGWDAIRTQGKKGGKDAA